MTVPPSSPLKIAVLGCGKIGSTFASQLTRVGHHEVTVIARSGSVRLQQLKRDGGIVEVTGERADVRVMDTLDEETPYDLLIVTLLDHQSQAMLPSLQRSAAKTVLFMFNTAIPNDWRKRSAPRAALLACRSCRRRWMVMANSRRRSAPQVRRRS